MLLDGVNLTMAEKVSPDTCTQIDEQPTYGESFVPERALLGLNWRF